MRIHRFQAVVVAYHHHVSPLFVLSCQPNSSGHHGLNGIATLGCNLQCVVFGHLGLAHRQREGIVFVRNGVEVDKENVAFIEQARRGNTDLLGFGRCEMVLSGLTRTEEQYEE